MVGGIPQYRDFSADQIANLRGLGLVTPRLDFELNEDQFQQYSWYVECAPAALLLFNWKAILSKDQFTNAVVTISGSHSRKRAENLADSLWQERKPEGRFPAHQLLSGILDLMRFESKVSSELHIWNWKPMGQTPRPQDQLPPNPVDQDFTQAIRFGNRCAKLVSLVPVRGPEIEKLTNVKWIRPSNVQWGKTLKLREDLELCDCMDESEDPFTCLRTRRTWPTVRVLNAAKPHFQNLDFAYPHLKLPFFPVWNPDNQPSPSAEEHRSKTRRAQAGFKSLEILRTFRVIANTETVEEAAWREIRLSCLTLLTWNFVQNLVDKSSLPGIDSARKYIWLQYTRYTNEQVEQFAELFWARLEVRPTTAPLCDPLTGPAELRHFSALTGHRFFNSSAALEFSIFRPLRTAHIDEAVSEGKLIRDCENLALNEFGKIRAGLEKTLHPFPLRGLTTRLAQQLYNGQSTPWSEIPPPFKLRGLGLAIRQYLTNFVDYDRSILDQIEDQDRVALWTTRHAPVDTMGKAAPYERKTSGGRSTEYWMRYDDTRPESQPIEKVRGEADLAHTQNQRRYDAIHAQFRRDRLPPQHAQLDDADVYMLMRLAHEDGKISVRSLHENWSGVFNTDGIPYSARRQLGRPAVELDIQHQKWRYVCIGGQYTLCGGGHLKTLLTDAELRTRDPVGRAKTHPWQRPRTLQFSSYKTNVKKGDQPLFQFEPDLEVDFGLIEWPEYYDVDRTTAKFLWAVGEYSIDQVVGIVTRDIHKQQLPIWAPYTEDLSDDDESVYDTKDTHRPVEIYSIPDAETTAAILRDMDPSRTGLELAGHIKKTAPRERSRQATQDHEEQIVDQVMRRPIEATTTSRPIGEPQSEMETTQPRVESTRQQSVPSQAAQSEVQSLTNTDANQYPQWRSLNTSSMQGQLLTDRFPPEMLQRLPGYNEPAHFGEPTQPGMQTWPKSSQPQVAMGPQTTSQSGSRPQSTPSVQPETNAFSYMGGHTTVVPPTRHDQVTPAVHTLANMGHLGSNALLEGAIHMIDQGETLIAIGHQMREKGTQMINASRAMAIMGIEGLEESAASSACPTIDSELPARFGLQPRRNPVAVDYEYCNENQLGKMLQSALPLRNRQLDTTNITSEFRNLVAPATHVQLSTNIPAAYLPARLATAQPTPPKSATFGETRTEHSHPTYDNPTPVPQAQPTNLPADTPASQPTQAISPSQMEMNRARLRQTKTTRESATSKRRRIR